MKAVGGQDKVDHLNLLALQLRFALSGLKHGAPPERSLRRFPVGGKVFLGDSPALVRHRLTGVDLAPSALANPRQFCVEGLGLIALFCFDGRTVFSSVCRTIDSINGCIGGDVYDMFKGLEAGPLHQRRMAARPRCVRWNQGCRLRRSSLVTPSFFTALLPKVGLVFSTVRILGHQ
jgi:hypothetical protein